MIGVSEIAQSALKDRDLPEVSPVAQLRDLVGRDFEARYDCDRFTATVLTNRFGFIIEHLVARVLTTAFSPIVRTGSDFAVALLGPPEMQYPLLGVSSTIPLFTGSLPDAVRISFEEYGVEKLRPGDVLLVNDYYRVGTHANDACFIQPIFHEGDIVAVVTIRAHMLDMGGKTPGGFALKKRDNYEDGLRIAPTLLYGHDGPSRSVFSLIFDNTRFAETVLPDIQSIKASLDIGNRLVIESLQKYGKPALLGTMRYACDASQELMGDALEAIPDGVYRGIETFDTDGYPDSPEYRVHLTVNKVGRRIEFDWSGSSIASRSALNAAWPDAKTAVIVGLKCMIDPYGHLTSGAMRDIDILLPPNSILNAHPPHACQFYNEIIGAMVSAVAYALKDAVGDRAFGAEASPLMNFVSGTNEDGAAWFSIGAGNWTSPWGATQKGDGDTNQAGLLNNLIISGIEDSEREGTALALACEALPDSGGPGQHRGGAAKINDTRWLVGGEQVCIQFHMKTPAPGAAGGKAGMLGGAFVWEETDDTVDTTRLPLAVHGQVYRTAKPVIGVINDVTNELDPDGRYYAAGAGSLVPARSTVRIVSNGGGGWGHPFSRDPQAVLRDVRDDYVSIAGASRDYGVVVLGDPAYDPEGLTVDSAATARLRGG